MRPPWPPTPWHELQRFSTNSRRPLSARPGNTYIGPSAGPPVPGATNAITLRSSAPVNDGRGMLRAAIADKAVRDAVYASVDRAAIAPEESTLLKNRPQRRPLSP